MSQLKAQTDKFLTNVSSAYVPSGYISEKALPSIKASQNTGKLAKYGNEHLRIENSLRGGRSEYRRVEPISRTSTTFSIEPHGLEGIIDKESRRNVEKPFRIESDEVIGLSTKLWLEKEKLLADTINSTSIITQNTTLSGTDQYSDAASDPLGDFKTARETVYSGCGMRPDTAIMSWEVFNCLRYHADILSALGFKDNRSGQMSDQELAKAMDVKRILIGDAVYNSAKEGQSDSLASVWGKHIVFAVLPANAMPYQTSLGYLVHLADEKPRQVYKTPINNPPGSTSIIVEDSYDMLISNAAAAYLIEDAIA